MISLHELNALDPERSRDLVRPCLDVARWVDGIVDGRPYASVDELFATTRLDNDVDTEDVVVADQLRQIALVRLAGLVSR